MTRWALTLVLGLAAAACGIKTNPTPAPPLWGEPDRAPVEEVRAPQSDVIVVDPSDPEALDIPPLGSDRSDEGE